MFQEIDQNDCQVTKRKRIKLKLLTMFNEKQRQN